jgi:hypothetical protein
MATKKSSSKKTSKQDEAFEQPEEHRVFSHLMYLLFLVATALAAYYTFNMFIQPETQAVTYMPVKALVLLGWAFIFKTFGHRIHYPHH